MAAGQPAAIFYANRKPVRFSSRPMDFWPEFRAASKEILIDVGRSQAIIVRLNDAGLTAHDHDRIGQVDLGYRNVGLNSKWE
jgi:hypothetical protein